MSVFTELSAFRAVHNNCVATIGKYDGLHLGHQHVLALLKKTAKARGLPSVVIISEPHPEEFFAGSKAPPRLSSFQDKADFLLSIGVDAIFRMTFDQGLCDLSAEDFIQQYLVSGLGIRALIIGDDFRFGSNRKGDFQLLIEKGREHDFEVIRGEPCMREGQRVSSTMVREALQSGDCEAVNSLLGRYYSLGGKVIEGKKLGRELGIPTANIALQNTVLPLQGIFCVQVRIGDKQLEGVASLGFNPTVENTDTPKLEVYLFDFDEDIYGQFLEVFFVKKLRDEVAFPDLDSLKAQMTQDIQMARQSLAQVAGNPT